MRIEQRFELPVAPERAWPAFRDIELLVACLPGASLTGPPVDGEVPLRFDVRLGPIAASFAGAGRVAFDDVQRTGRFEGNAADRRSGSRVKGAADFALSPAAEGSRVEVVVDYALTGTLAQFGRGGIVRELANALTAQFAAQLESRIRSGLPPPADTSMPSEPSHVPLADDARPAPAPAAAMIPAAPLSVVPLIVAMLKARWRRIVNRWSRRTPA